MLTDKQNKQLLEAVDLLQRADVLVQQAMGHDEECYYIHTQIQNSSDDILDFVQQNNPEIEIDG